MTVDEAMSRAVELAEEAWESGDVPIGALILSEEGDIVGEGKNVREALFDPVGHAEIIALRDAGSQRKSWRLLNCTLVTTLEPCPMCLGAAVNARVSRIVYGAKDPKGGALSLGYTMGTDGKLNHTLEVEYRFNERCSTLLSEFFKQRRKKEIKL